MGVRSQTGHAKPGESDKKGEVKNTKETSPIINKKAQKIKQNLKCVCGEATEMVRAGEWKCGTNGCHAVLDNFPLLIDLHGMRTTTQKFRSLPTCC